MYRLIWLVVVFVGCGGAQSAGPPPPPAEHHTAMHHRFDNAEQWSKVFDDPGRDAWQQPDKVVAALELAPTMVVADIGAGTGYFAMRLARAVPQGQVIATDIEPDMIKFMTERAQREGLGNVRAVVTPPADPQLAEASLDRILVVDVWHHIDDRAGYARALARALKPGGKLAIVDFTAASSHGPPPQHRLPPDEVLGELRSAGLTAALSPTALPEQYIAIGTR